MTTVKLYPRDRHEKTPQLKRMSISNCSLQLHLERSVKRSLNYTLNWEVLPGKHAFLELTWQHAVSQHYSIWNKC